VLTPIDLLPAKLVLGLASPYIAGKNAQQTLSLARSLYEKDHFTSTIDILGEAATSSEQCQHYVEIFLEVITLIAKSPLPVLEKQKQFTLSFKPSMLCVSSSADVLPNQKNLQMGYERMQQIVNHAFKHNVNMTLEAEHSIWTDYHLDSYFSLLDAGYTNLGTVLQTRLFRTAQDIKRFDKRTRVRLVIGIYEEKAKIAYTAKKQMKELLIEYSRKLLEAGAYVELATHDQYYINKFLAEIVSPLHLNSSRFEIQFLLGVPRYKLQKDLVLSGNVVRLYLPFGSDESAGPYCKRRLKSNPNLLIYGLKNLMGIQ
jgi:proline dehydrogenase